MRSIMYCWPTMTRPTSFSRRSTKALSFATSSFKARTSYMAPEDVDRRWARANARAPAYITATGVDHADAGARPLIPGRSARRLLYSLIASVHWSHVSAAPVAR